MKTPAQAATAYGTNGGSATSTTNWATNFNANFDAIIAAAKKAIPAWQAAVATQEAADRMASGLDGALANRTAISAKVNGPGKTSFAAGVVAASKGKYLDFANVFLPAVATEVAQLDRTNARGTKAENRARLNAYLDWLDTKAGSFRQ